MRCFYMAVMVTVGVGSSPVIAAFWDVEPVYLGGFASGDSSLVVNNENVPCVSYGADGNIYFAVKTASGWSSEFVAAAGYWGGWSSLARVPGAGFQPAIAFVDTINMPDNTVRYVYKSAGSWRAETVDVIGWQPERVSLAFNSENQACVAYSRTVGEYPNETMHVRFARRTGASVWVRQDVAQVGAVTAPSLVSVSPDTLCVAFTDAASGALKIAKQSGGGQWQISRVDGSVSAPVVGSPSLVGLPGSKLAVAYFASSGGSVSLKYARLDKSVWVMEQAAVVGSGGALSCSLRVTPGGTPLIAFNDAGGGVFKCAWKSGGRWFVQTVDDSPQTGGSSSLALDGLGNAHVSYFDGYDSFVKYAGAVAPRSLREAMSLEDGQVVQVSGLIASSAGWEIESRIYAQNPDRTRGIQLYFTGAVPAIPRGAVLDVRGTMSTEGGERVIKDPVLVRIGAEPG